MGCKYKHEMPSDKATQMSLGLNHGYPSWYRRTFTVGNNLSSPATEHQLQSLGSPTSATRINGPWRQLESGQGSNGNGIFHQDPCSFFSIVLIHVLQVHLPPLVPLEPPFPAIFPSTDARACKPVALRLSRKKMRTSATTLAAVQIPKLECSSTSS